MKIKPFGSKLLVLPKPKENFITESKIEIVETSLAKGVVVEVSDDFSNVLKEGDVVVHTAEIGKPQRYNGKDCLWIDARPINQGGDLWFVEIEEKGL